MSVLDQYGLKERWVMGNVMPNIHQHQGFDPSHIDRVFNRID